MKYLTVKTASIILNISPTRVRAKIKQKKRKCFPGAIMPGNEWLIPEHEVINELDYKARYEKLD